MKTLIYIVGISMIFAGISADKGGGGLFLLGIFIVLFNGMVGKSE